MNCLKKLTSFVLAGAICLGLISPAVAAEKLSLSATLDKTVVYIDDGAQEITLTVKGDSEFNVSSASMDIVATDTNGNKLTASSVSSSVLTDCTLTGGKILAATGDGSNATTDTVVTIKFPIDENTAVGTYTVGVENLELVYDSWQTHEVSTTVTTTLDVKQSKETSVTGYTAQVTADSAVTVGDTVTVNVGVGHNTDTTFHAAEIVLSYDASALTLVDSSLETNNLKYTNTNGVLTIENFDEEHTMGTGVYTIKFTANTVGTTNVTLTSAKFIDKENASVSDLVGATITTASATVTVNEVAYEVTTTTDSVTTGLTIPAEVTKGTDLVIEAADTNLWNYSITAKIGETSVDVTGPVDGKFTISKDVITGDIVLTTSRTAKQFGVEWTGDGANDVTDKAYTATYNTDFSFTVPAKVEATATQAGVNYSATVSIEGSTYNASAGAGETVTIPGDQITGKVTISVDKEELAANGKTISISGEDVKFDDGTTSKTVSPGTELTLNLTVETGYTYSVKMGDSEIMNNTTTTYKLTVGDSDVTINVEKTLITDGLVNVYDYVTLDSTDGEHLWLVTFAPTLVEGKIPTYDSNAMYWSAKYNAYCYLVKATSLDTDTASGKLNVTTAIATSVDYTGNVNNSAYTDAADAQFVANMYNAMYSDIDNTVTMAKFLSADMNGDKQIDITDAQTIVKQILGINN